MRLLPTHRPRGLFWLTPIVGILLAVGVWLGVKEQPGPDVGSTPAAPTQEPTPAVSAEASAPSDLAPMPDRPEHEPWDAPTREELESQLESFFGDPREGRSKIPLTAEEFADAEVQMKLFDLMSQVTIAADYGVDLRNLEGYGIVMNKDGTVSINHNVHQRWIRVDSFLDSLGREPWREIHLTALRSKGLSEDVIKGIEERARRSHSPDLL